MKNYVIVTSPKDSTSSERMKELRDKAKGFYGTKEYKGKEIDQDLSKAIADVLKRLVDNGHDINANLFVLGTQLVFISQVDSVYFPHNWADDDFCKDVHLLCFKYGIDIHYEPV